MPEFFAGSDRFGVLFGNLGLYSQATRSLSGSVNFRCPVKNFDASKKAVLLCRALHHCQAVAFWLGIACRGLVTRPYSAICVQAIEKMAPAGTPLTLIRG